MVSNKRKKGKEGWRRRFPAVKTGRDDRLQEVLSVVLWSVVVWSVVMLPSATMAAPMEPVVVSNTWDAAGDVEGWYNNTTRMKVTNPGGYLNVNFRAQSLPMSESTIVRKDISDMVPQRISFKMKAVGVAPSSVRVYLNSSSGKSWYIELEAPAAGEEAVYSVAVSFEAGWTIGPASTRVQFDYDKEHVSWVGVYFRRGGSGGAQDFQIDDFVLEALEPAVDTDGDGMADVWEIAAGLDPYSATDAAEDSDGDGMSNYAEYWAGTDANDPSSTLSLDLEVPAEEEDEPGIIVVWPSEPYRTYSILRCTNLISGFSPLYTGIPATPPKNIYRDNTATGMGPYFYKVKVE